MSLLAASKTPEIQSHTGSGARPLRGGDGGETPQPEVTASASGAADPRHASAATLGEGADTQFMHTPHAAWSYFDPPTMPAPVPVDSAAGPRVEALQVTAPRPYDARESSTLPRGLPGQVAAPDADAPVRQVGRYLVQQRLGRGGTATVYRAHDPTIGRPVAIKFLHASLCSDEDCRKRFLREARAAGALSHPNIVTVHDVAEIDGRPCMAMELLSGRSLAEELERRGTLPVRDTVVIGLQLAQALEYAHSRGIVHRDIKPGNIMLQADGLSIKVTDFGIAHMEDAGTAQQPAPGTVIGTPQYMSPEQARGEPLDGRSDLFAAGIVLYQMLTGRRPFLGDDLAAVAHQITHAEPVAISTHRADVPASLRRVVDRCLAKHPMRRFATGAEMATSLRQVLDEIDAGSAAVARDASRGLPLRMKWALTVMAVVAVVMGLAAAVISQRQYAALAQQAGEHGAAMARIVAAQVAEPMLAEEWERVDQSLRAAMKAVPFERFVAIDAAGVVRAASLKALVGRPYQSPVGEALPAPRHDVASTRFQTSNGPLLSFETPLVARDKPVGSVAIGVAERPVADLARHFIVLLGVFALVSLLAVALATYWVAQWFARPMGVLVDAMDEVARGRWAHRVGEARTVEFGEVFQAFDQMAEALQQREHSHAPRPVPVTRAAAAVSG